MIERQFGVLAAPGPSGSRALSRALLDVLDAFVAPVETFKRLRAEPHWRIAFAVAIGLIVAAGIVAQPATDYATNAALQHRIAGLGPAAAAGAARASSVHTSPAMTALGCALGGTAAMLFAAAVANVFGAAFGAGRGFVYAWSMTCTSYVVCAFGSLMNSCILAARGPAAASRMADLFALPSAGTWASDGPASMALSVVNPLNAWYLGLVVLGLVFVLGVRRPAAIAAAAGWMALTAGFYYIVGAAAVRIIGS